ncbi:MAG: hypothetical protein ACP5R4_01265 [Armatimonadota bacterium]
MLQIEALNQRGGRLLTFVDLIEAGTVSEELVAYFLCAVAGGASFITAAVPGNAGKTTVLACLLSLLPPQTEIFTIADAYHLYAAQRDHSGKRICYLVHEISDGPFYSYLWGAHVDRFLALRGNKRQIAASMHSDSPEHMEQVLVRELGVNRDRFNSIELLVFLRMDRIQLGLRRRVASVYEAAQDGKHRLVYSWNPKTDSHDLIEAPHLPWCSEVNLSSAAEFIRATRKDNIRSLRVFRERVVEFLQSGGLRP